MEKQIENFWIAGFFLPAINATVFSPQFTNKRTQYELTFRYILALKNTNEAKGTRPEIKSSSQQELNRMQPVFSIRGEGQQSVLLSTFSSLNCKNLGIFFTTAKANTKITNLWHACYHSVRFNEVIDQNKNRYKYFTLFVKISSMLQYRVSHNEMVETKSL